MATKKRGGDVCIFSFGGQSAFSSKFGNYAQRKSQGVRQTIHRLHNLVIILIIIRCSFKHSFATEKIEIDLWRIIGIIGFDDELMTANTSL